MSPKLQARFLRVLQGRFIFEAMSGLFFPIKEEARPSSMEDAACTGALRQIEDEMIKKVLQETKGNKTLAAEKLGISITTLWRRLKQIKKRSCASY